MFSFASTGTELRRFRRGLLPKVAIGALVLIPLLYGALYLWAFWDPTGNLKRLPVALVNDDRAVTAADGSTVDAGSEVVDALLDSGVVEWQQTDAADAADGVEHGRYYFAVTIPADFSADVASAGGDQPEQASLAVTYNDANSFLASTLGKTAMQQVHEAVSQSIGTQAVDKVLVGLGAARDGFGQASDGALTLDAAANQVSSGATQLAAGADDAAGGAKSLASGAASLKKGAADAASGAATLAAGAKSAAAGASTLASSAHELAKGAETASSSSGQLASGAAALQSGVHSATSQIGSLMGQLPTLESSLGSIGTYLGGRAAGGDTTAYALLQGLQSASATLPTSSQLSALNGQLGQLDSGADQVAAGAADLASGLGTLSGGAGQLASGASDLSDGVAQVSTGAASLSSGLGTLSGGATQLSGGAAQLSGGAATLASSAHALADGTVQINQGTGELASSLSDGAAQLPADDAAAQSTRADVIAEPVTLASADLNQAEGFGEGFAPFFIPLALFVGALITFLLLRPLPSRALATPASGLRATLAGFLPAAIIGVAQVAVMLAVIHYGVGLEMDTAVGTIAFTLLVALSFIALQQMLTAIMGPAAGKVAILALLMLQLSSSGGTYPVQTTPEFFRVIHPWLPMSYAVDGLRMVITGGADARLWIAVAYLGALLVGSLAITAWRAGRMRTWTMARLHPVLEI